MYCQHCGKDVPDGVRFCRYCGSEQAQQDKTSLNKRRRLLEGFSPQINVQAQPNIVSPVSRSAAGNKKSLKILMLLVSTLLIFMGIGHMALALAGRTVNAQVTGYQQALIINNDESTRNPSRYKVDYEFSVNGSSYTGSVTRVFTGGSHMRKTLPVRYLPFWPHVNSEDSARLSPFGLIIIGAGILLFVLEVKRKPRIGKEGWPVEREREQQQAAVKEKAEKKTMRAAYTKW